MGAMIEVTLLWMLEYRPVPLEPIFDGHGSLIRSNELHLWLNLPEHARMASRLLTIKRQNNMMLFRRKLRACHMHVIDWWAHRAIEQVRVWICFGHAPPRIISFDPCPEIGEGIEEVN